MNQETAKRRCSESWHAFYPNQQRKRDSQFNSLTPNRKFKKELTEEFQRLKLEEKTMIESSMEQSFRISNPMTELEFHFGKTIEGEIEDLRIKKNDHDLEMVSLPKAVSPCSFMATTFSREIEENE